LVEICGTEGYACPEIQEDQGAYYGQQVDIFSLGVTLFTMCTGASPFESATKQDKKYLNLFLADRAPIFWGKLQRENRIECTEEFKSLITSMLAYDFRRRPSLAEIVNHPWITRYPIPTPQEIYDEFTKRKLCMKKFSGIINDKDMELIAQMKEQLEFKKSQYKLN